MSLTWMSHTWRREDGKMCRSYLCPGCAAELLESGELSIHEVEEVKAPHDHDCSACQAAGYEEVA